jgi:crossover junction endodeoxyribonuclease RuvC
MIVLGVDPGTLVTGYGLIEKRNGAIRVLASGCIRSGAESSMPLRLMRIFDTLNTVISKHHPDEFAIETAFYGKNAQSALKLGQARGVAMLAAVAKEIPTREYSPREVKRAIVGNGSASKEQVQYMVRVLLHLKASPGVYDVTDALAVAMCHMNRRSVAPAGTSPARKNAGRGSASWKSFVVAHPERVASPTRGPKR